MKTVQDYLKELDKEKLINTYFNLYPIKYETFNHDFSISEIKNKCYKQIKGYIFVLKNLEPIILEKQEQRILFAYEIINNQIKGIDISFISLDNLIKGKMEIPIYSIECMAPEQIVYFLVADTLLLKNNIYEVMSHILNIISLDFASRINKNIKSFRQIIVDAAKKALTEVFEMKNENNQNLDEIDLKENELFVKAYQAKTEYTKYSQRKELCKIRSFLMN